MGFTYRGKHSLRDIGVYTETKTRPFIPPPKTEFNENVPYMDGSLDYSEAGGRVFYEDKILEVSFILLKSDKIKRNKIIERFASWIAGGKGELIFDDMPLVKWIASPIDTKDITITLNKIGKCTVEFRCAPFNEFVYNTGEGIPLDCDISLDADFPIGWGDSFDLSNGDNEIVVENDGTAYVRPIIRIEGDFRNISITIGNNTISYNKVFTSIDIDCECLAVFENDADVTSNSAGEFIELAPGDNKAIISAEGSGTILFVFNPKYFYDTNFIF